MNLLNEKANHIKFGTGVIKSYENGIIRIQFGEEFGEKAFLYPTAFEHFLKFNNSLLDETVQDELKQIVPEKERQRREAEQLKEDDRREKQERAKLKSKATKALAAKLAKQAKLKSDNSLLQHIAGDGLSV